MKEIHFVIYGDPKGKKNSQSIIRVGGRPMIIQGKVYRGYEATAKKYVPKLTRPLPGPVNVKAVFYRRERRNVDLTNLLEALDDVLVKYGVLADDGRDVLASHDGSLVLWDKENPRTDVTISGKEDYEQWKK